MKPEIVFAMYRPREGKESELLALIKEHIPTLRRFELITDRPSILVRSKNGTYIEIFEWRSKESAEVAHEHPAVAKVWEAMGGVSDFPGLDSLEEAAGKFPHFQPVNLLDEHGATV